MIVFVIVFVKIVVKVIVVVVFGIVNVTIIDAAILIVIVDASCNC